MEELYVARGMSAQDAKIAVSGGPYLAAGCCHRPFENLCVTVHTRLVTILCKPLANLTMPPPPVALLLLLLAPAGDRHLQVPRLLRGRDDGA